MRHLAAIFVGGVVTLVLGALILGPDTLGLVLLLLVMCTFGVGLIPLILVFWAVGRLVLSFFPGGSTQAVGPAGSPAQQGRETRVDAVAGYIERARRRGKSDGEIQRCLTRAGWPSDEINEAWEHCAEHG
jgi:hypothetical protein